ncbi:SBBP repeat-containing protein [Litorilinea aerophila]|uniref:DUF11 domain-containing protein n=1 Tax=Litorilinea aerophila TaxID=1204385 RepID=A0A540VK78_9CHLR|nr:SBBP repeat-containing protein [Litorilinea aerophila]MCC9075203.1 SBBP repeat-containing protein [Litorilinea aerophila]
MKTKIWQIGILLSLLALTLSRPAAAQVGAGTGSDPAMPALGSSSVMFIENVGQFPEGVRFRVYGGDRALWLAEDALWISAVERAQGGTLERLRGEPANVEPANVQGVNLKLTFPGATPHPRLEPFGRLETSVNYFLGNDPEKWRTHVPVWSGVRYVDLYPGVDLEVTGEAGRWSWRLVTRAGADLSAVHLQVEGAEEEEVDVLATASGRQGLRLRTAVGDFTLPLLRVERANVERGNVERINAQTFEVTSPFSSAPWLPGPSVQAAGASDLAYATFLGGSGGDQSYAIAVDGSGNAYVTGWTDSPDFPATPGAYDSFHNGSSDAFVAKLSPTGNTLLYTSFLGGAGNEWGNDIIVDQNGNAYVTGTTDSYDFPVTLEAYDVSFNGNRDIFVAKLNPTGNNLLYATFLGGSNLDGGTGIDVDGNGNAYITGTTESSDFPTTPGAHDMGFNGYVDVFIAKLGSLGSNLAYATFLGGSSWDDGARIAVDTDGNAYITGTTSSFDFPVTPKAYNTSFNGGYHDIFVAKFSPIGSDLLYATFLGGNNEDFGSDIAVDPDGNALITGNTSSSDFPVTPGAYDTSLDGPSDVFVTKLGPEGGNVLYATFLGGSNWDLGTGIHVDENGNAYITGQTLSSDFPATPEVYDNSLNNGHNNYDNLDIFLVKLNPMENDLPYVTLLGGTDREESQDITIDKNGNIYVTGWTGSSDFPITPGAFDNVFDGDSDTFVVKLAPDVEPATHSVSGRVTNANGAPLSGVTITDDAGHTTTTDGDGRYTLSGLAEGTYTVTPAKEDFTFSPASRTVSVPPDATGVDFVGRSTAMVDPMRSVLYSQPDSVPADGASRASIVVQLLNAAGQPVPGKTVWLESSRGVLDLVEQPLLATDNNGRVVGSVRSTAPGTATIFATVLDDGIRLSRSTVVTFTTYAPPSGTFLHSIDRIVNIATDSLDYIKGDAQEIAEHGAYFRGEIGANAAQLAADFVFGMADVLGGLSQSGNLENLKLAFRLKCPGCYIPGTWNTQFANAHPRVYRLFELSFAKLGGTPPEELTELLGWGGLKFFTGELAGYSAKSLSKSIAKDQLRKHLFGVNDGTQTLLYPTVDRTAEELKDFLRERRSQLLANLPGMSEADQKTYEADLKLRTGALILLGQRLRYPRLTLTDLRRAHSERSNALANFVWRTSAKLLASYFLDGAGLVALGGSRTLLDTYVNAKNLGESIQMYNLAVSTLAGSPDILQQIHETASRGLLQILLRQDPNPATGRVQRIVHRSEGTGWGPFWNETDSWSEVHLENTSSNEVTFYVTARYRVDTSRFGLPWATIFTQEEATINLKPGTTGVVRLNYKKDSGTTGISPTQESDIEFVILGANDWGVYFVDSVISSWNPTRLSSSSAAASSAEQEAMPIDPPLSTYILPVPWRQQHEAQLWINNPFTSTVPVTVTQTLPAGIELLDAGGAVQSGSSITWHTVVNPTAMKVLTFTFGFPGAPGTEGMLPPATLSLVNPLDGQELTADSNAVAFQALWPFALDYALPRAVLPGEEVPVVVTVTNWLEENPVSGSLTIRVLDTLSNTVYTNSQPFEVPNGSEATVLFALPGTLAKGNYVVRGQVNAESASHEAFADLVQVGLPGPNLNYEVTPLGVVYPGDFLTYTLSFTNSLGFPLNNTVLTTSIPAGVTVLPQSITDGGTIEFGQVRWMLGTVENGEKVERSFVVKVNTEVVSSTKRLYLTSEPRLTADEIAPVLGITMLNTAIVPENSTQNVIYLPVVQTLYPNPREQRTESLKSLEWRIYLPWAGR